MKGADMGRIYRLCHALDSLQSRWSGANVRHHQRYRMKMAALPHPLEDKEPGGRATQAVATARFPPCAASWASTSVSSTDRACPQ